MINLFTQIQFFNINCDAQWICYASVFFISPNEKATAEFHQKGLKVTEIHPNKPIIICFYRQQHFYRTFYVGFQR